MHPSGCPHHKVFPHKFFSCGPGGGEKLFDSGRSRRKGQEYPQGIRTKTFMLCCLLVPDKRHYKNGVREAQKVIFCCVNDSLLESQSIGIVGSRCSGPKKTVTASDGTGFCAIFSPRKMGNSPHFGQGYVNRGFQTVVRDFQTSRG